ncbi:hypothetical protein Tco_0891563 [Tanacetum coccineum]|uniref:Uncharacterized protein n=1 Tax=Tanacetum coccineum TaxID=301880 RepID=A0ABQ5C3L9_9ASTR
MFPHILCLDLFGLSRFGYLNLSKAAIFGGIGTPKSYQGDWLGRGNNCLKDLIIDSRVNLDLTPTISEQQTIWYTAFRKFYMSYIPRSPPTTYTDLFDDYMKKLSSSRKRGKIDTRDLPIIRRCDTTSVEEIRLKDGVIAKLNSRVFKLEAIIKVLGRERKGVSLDKSCVAEIFNNFSSGCWEELNEEFNELCETKFCVNGPAMIDLDSDEDLVTDFNPPLCELPFHKEVTRFETLLSFSSKNEEKVFNPGILTSKGVHTSLFPELSHRGPNAFKVIKIFESPMEIFPCSGEDSPTRFEEERVRMH